MDSPADIAISLVDRLLAGQLSVQNFCELYERHWNFDWPGRGLAQAAEQFRVLFEAVAWYSLLPEERAVVPNYTSEEQVLKVARQVRAAVGA